MNIANIGLLPTRDSIYRIFLGKVLLISTVIILLIFFSFLFYPLPMALLLSQSH